MFKEFDKMQKKMFEGFGDIFGIGSMKPGFSNFGDIHKEMRDMMAFSNIGNIIEPSKNGSSKVITRSYVHDTKLDPNGNKYTEKYFSNNYAMRGEDGTTLSERQQAYQNSLDRQQKIAEERMLNNKGKKLIQERVLGGPINKTQHFYNLEENRVDEFDRDWENYTNKFGFYDAFGKQLRYDGGKKRINHPDYQYNQPNRNEYYSPKKNYTNDDPVYISDQPYYGRVRNNDL